MATNQVVPAQERRITEQGEFIGFYDPPRYRYTEDFPKLVARGVMPIKYLVGDRFKGCVEPSHVGDVLLSEGEYSRPDYDDEIMKELTEKEVSLYRERIDKWQEFYDRDKKSARERVKKRRQRA